MTGRLFDDLGAADTMHHLITVTLMARSSMISHEQVALDPSLAQAQAKQQSAVAGIERVLMSHGWVKPTLPVPLESQGFASDEAE
jgi:hypothetical protein